MMPAYYFTVFDHESSLLTHPEHSYVLERGQTLLRNFMLHEIKTHAACGGKAICGDCRVKVLSSQKYCNKPVDEEKVILDEQQLKQGWRLACQLYCLKNISVFIPPKDKSITIE